MKFQTLKVDPDIQSGNTILPDKVDLETTTYSLDLFLNKKGKKEIVYKMNSNFGFD
jgi:hypothetical protein